MGDLVIEILGEWDEMIGERARHNVEKIGAEALARYIEGSLHYGDDFQDETGLKGQWCDIKRKVGPLKRALWDEAILTRESPREICLDLIGHLLMTVDMIDRQADRDAFDRPELRSAEHRREVPVDFS